jgi:hypothetical protein
LQRLSHFKSSLSCCEGHLHVTLFCSVSGFSDNTIPIHVHFYNRFTLITQVRHNNTSISKHNYLSSVSQQVPLKLWPEVFLPRVTYRDIDIDLYRLVIDSPKSRVFTGECVSRNSVAASNYIIAIHTKPHVLSYLTLYILVYLSLLFHSLVCNLATDENQFLELSEYGFYSKWLWVVSSVNNETCHVYMNGVTTYCHRFNTKVICVLK